MDDRLTVFQFVHHFPTHTIVWEIWESDWQDLEHIPEKMRGSFFTGADGKMYMGTQPLMMPRVKAEDYVRTADDSYSRYEVIEIEHTEPKLVDSAGTTYEMIDGRMMARRMFASGFVPVSLG